VLWNLAPDKDSGRDGSHTGHQGPESLGVAPGEPEGHRNSDHARDLPFTNRSLYGPRTVAGARACPRPLSTPRLLIRAADLRVNEEDWFEGCKVEIGSLTQAVLPPFRDEAETGKHGSAAASEAKMGTV
jgi:hypothetical protein